LIETWIQDPDGIQIVLVEVPADHQRLLAPRRTVQAGEVRARNRLVGANEVQRNATVDGAGSAPSSDAEVLLRDMSHLFLAGSIYRTTTTRQGFSPAEKVR